MVGFVGGWGWGGEEEENEEYSAELKREDQVDLEAKGQADLEAVMPDSKQVRRMKDNTLPKGWKIETGRLM